MASTIVTTGVLYEDDSLSEAKTEITSDKNNILFKNKYEYKRQIVWKYVSFYAFIHIATLYGLYLIFTSTKTLTILFAIFLYLISGLGVTAGAHRLWSHRSYKAKWPLNLMLVIFNTIAFQDSVINWSRNHRLHHKYCDTDADPYNSKRGFFFCHMGWLMCRKHPAVLEKGKGIDLSDLYHDPILKFQKKYYVILMPIFTFFIPTVIPMYFWNETFVNSFFVPSMFRFTISLNVACMINSFAHLFGNKPYDRYISSSQSKILSVLTLGEGWHNYHHTFPWDYKAAELGNFWYNLTTAFIDFFAKIGWAYDLKTVPMDMVKKRVQRTGDGSHALWGWGDKDQSQEDRNVTIRTYKASD